ncbi:MAG: TIM-barrel domain-containing protein [Anaerolineae bacterium]
MKIFLRWPVLVLGMLLATALLLPPVPLDASGLTHRYFPPPAWTLGPIIGSAKYETDWNAILDQVESNGYPITALHFDASHWETCNNNGDPALSDAFIQRMRADHLRAVLWIVPLIDLRCAEYHTAANQDYFVRVNGQILVTSTAQGHGSWIDFNKPGAVAFWHSLLDRAATKFGDVLGGFYIDDMRPDLSQDPSYADVYAFDLLKYTRARIPDGDVVMKRYGHNTPSDNFLRYYAHATYVNDAYSDWTGMRSKVRNVMNTAKLVPAAFSEFPGYNGPVPTAEIYTRRLHWGAFQVLMEDDTQRSFFPWNTPALASTLPAYRYYTTLHRELVPYLYSYDEAAYETNTPILRNSNTLQFSTQIGQEIFVKYVTASVQSVSFTLPAGQWINYWNESQSWTGPRTLSLPAPLGHEPVLIRNGAIIPMGVQSATTGHGTAASAGALTVNVFASGASSFRYYDPTGFWSTLSANLNGTALTLCSQPAPSQPLIYRVARWAAAPASVTTSNGAVGVNVGWGTALPQLASEGDVDASTGGWFYDSAAQHLIVKPGTGGADCPA